MVPGRRVEVADWDGALAVGAGDVNDGTLSAARATLMSEGLVAIHLRCFRAEDMAWMRLKPSDMAAGQPLPGVRLLQAGEGGVHEVVAAGALHEVPAGGGHVAGGVVGEAPLRRAWERSG